MLDVTFPLQALFLLQSQIENPDNVNSTLAWVAGLAVTALGAVAFRHFSALDSHAKTILELKDLEAKRIDALNKEMRETLQVVIEKLHESTQSLENAIGETSKLHPEFKAYIKDGFETITRTLEKIQEIVRK